MYQRKVFSIALAMGLLFTGLTQAEPLQGDRYRCRQGYDLNTYTGQSLLSVLENDVQKAMNETARTCGLMNKNKALKKRCCVTVKIDKDNFTWHVNYPSNDAKKGRSFGQGPGGTIDDPSDREYLDDLAEVSKGDQKNYAQFIRAVIKVVGNSDATGYRGLDDDGQDLATDFTAVYIAEQKRHFVNQSNWDDALLQVTLLSAFHSGQDQFKMFYEGRLRSEVYENLLKLYKQPDERKELREKLALKGKKLETRQAVLHDYWQYGVSKTGSGINVTRRDFKLMGEAITEYELKTQKGKRLIENIEKIMKRGHDGNIFRAIGTYMTRKSHPETTDKLADAIVEFLDQVRTDANAITDSIKDSGRDDFESEPGNDDLGDRESRD